MIYYTSDLHFSHEFTMNRSQRPFSTVEEMDRMLIANWNQTVSLEDTVYVVGDLGLRSGPVPGTQLSQLNGHKHLIRGNYETGIENQQELLQYFETVTDFNEIEDEGRHVILCHYPILHTKNGFMIHGHLHNSKEMEYEMLKQLPCVLNCGVDVNHYRPVTLDELIENNRVFYECPNKGIRLTRKGPYPHPIKAVFHPLPNSKK